MEHQPSQEPQPLDYRDVIHLLPSFSEVQGQYPGLCEEEVSWIYQDMVNEKIEQEQNNDMDK